MSQPTISAWNNHQKLVDETEFTPWAQEGWKSWNGQSPEQSVCLFTEILIGMTRPQLVLETGVGQGYMTRAIVPMLTAYGGNLLAFESNDRWREELWNLPFWNDHHPAARLSEHPRPLIDHIVHAGVCIFDSDWETRFDEVRDWHAFAQPGAVAIIHDTGEQPETIHKSLRDLTSDLGMTGVFLKNPRGCFMAVQPKE